MSSHKTNLRIERFFYQLETSLANQRPDNRSSRNKRSTPIIRWVAGKIETELSCIITEVERVFKEDHGTFIVDSVALDMSLLDDDGAPYRPLMYSLISSKGQVRAIVITRHQDEVGRV